MIGKRTAVPAAWIAQKLVMGVSIRAARLVAQDSRLGRGADWKWAQACQRKLHEKAENLD